MSAPAEVWLWGTRIGAVSLADAESVATFEYDPRFLGSGIEVSPLMMPLSRELYRFPELPLPSFHGLPGLLSDSLPDRFGNDVIDAWLASQGRGPEEFNAIERLCYTGARGMGALEFRPALGPDPQPTRELEVAALVQLSSDIMNRRHDLSASFAREERSGALADILRVGTSAGGARAKAVIAWNPKTQEVRSGQIEAESGFEPWILKFDGVEEASHRELTTSSGYGAIEFAYSEMAKAAGIEMTACRLLEEGGRRHFMTRRFDRDENGRKLHMQTLGGIAHYDFNAQGANSYEQAIAVCRRLDLGMLAIEELFRRMVFNVVARNQDDHVKNIAFLMDRKGRWSLAPAYDMVFSYNPRGTWTSRHQMSLAGKRDGFELSDFETVAKSISLARGRARDLYDEVRESVARWPEFAGRAAVPEELVKASAAEQRVSLG